MAKGGGWDEMEIEVEKRQMIVVATERTRPFGEGLTLIYVTFEVQR